MEMTSHEKGAVLERGVHSLESVLLLCDLDFGNKDFQIQRNKRIKYKGVTHEIDVFVEITKRFKRKSVVIFECKNLKGKVDKNDVIVFSEKIKITKAVKGIFLAKEFTSGAVAQAKQNKKLKLLKFTADMENLSNLFDFHVFYLAKKELLKIKCLEFDTEPDESSKKIMEHNFQLTINGQQKDFIDYINSVGEEAIKKDSAPQKTKELPSGKHDFYVDEWIDFNRNELFLNGMNIKTILLRIKYSGEIRHPEIIAEFDIEKRGRVVMMKPVELSNGVKLEVERVEFLFEKTYLDRVSSKKRD